MTITDVQTYEVRASSRSVWTFVEVTSADGLIGCGEATVRDSQERIVPQLRSLAAAANRHDRPRRFLAAIPDPGDLPDVNARCALDQALEDIEAQREGQPIWKRYTAQPRKDISVYANVNRRTFDRSAEGFARSAGDALASGANAVKIAPFDGVKPSMSLTDARPLLATAFDRIRAVRNVIGSRKLLIDCHWRLNVQTIGPVLDVAAEANLFWIETPFPEEPQRYDDIRRARSAANRLGILLAGCELKAWESGFAPYLENELYDVLMPDMKYVGGYAAFFALSRAAKARGMVISPHNPSGPICHAHSVHVSAAIENFLILEMQFDETAAFTSIAQGQLPMPKYGFVNPTHFPGLSARLRQECIAEYPLHR